MRREWSIGSAEFAAELVRLKVDIIMIAGGNRLILAAKNGDQMIADFKF